MRSDGYSRENEINNISQSLKNIAKELDVPVITLSQLSRKVEDRKGCIPQLSDLRESGAIEQDADMVIFLYRPEYYEIFQDADGQDLTGKAKLILAKHRNGPLGDIKLRFQAELTDFHNL